MKNIYYQIIVLVLVVSVIWQYLMLGQIRRRYFISRGSDQMISICHDVKKDYLLIIRPPGADTNGLSTCADFTATNRLFEE